MNQIVRAAVDRTFTTLVAFLALVLPAFCTTWIVDASNGPNTNFTNIPQAIAAAAPGDVIIVRSGSSYSGFTATRGVTVLGEGTVLTIDDIVFSGLPVGDIAIISGVSPGYGKRLRVDSCVGTVLARRVDAAMAVTASADVRVSSSTCVSHLLYEPAVRVINSRVQIVESSLHGQLGWGADCFNPGDDGSPGLGCFGASRVHLVRSTTTGGDGGASFPLCLQNGGGGGNGVFASGTAGGPPLQLILTGSGGLGQAIGGAGYFGQGDSLYLDHTNAWSSQMSYSGAVNTYGGSSISYPAIPEPTLEMIGTPTPGNLVTLRLRAPVGVAVRLNLGRAPLVQPQPGILVEGLVLKERSFDRGLMPGSGVLDTPWQVFPSAPYGKLLIFQCKVTDPGTNVTQKTNSIELIVQ